VRNNISKIYKGGKVMKRFFILFGLLLGCYLCSGCSVGIEMAEHVVRSAKIDDEIHDYVLNGHPYRQSKQFQLIYNVWQNIKIGEKAKKVVSFARQQNIQDMFLDKNNNQLTIRIPYSGPMPFFYKGSNFKNLKGRTPVKRNAIHCAEISISFDDNKIIMQRKINFLYSCPGAQKQKSRLLNNPFVNLAKSLAYPEEPYLIGECLFSDPHYIPIPELPGIIGLSKTEIHNKYFTPTKFDANRNSDLYVLADHTGMTRHPGNTRFIKNNLSMTGGYFSDKCISHAQYYVEIFYNKENRAERLHISFPHPLFEQYFSQYIANNNVSNCAKLNTTWVILPNQLLHLADLYDYIGQDREKIEPYLMSIPSRTIGISNYHKYSYIYTQETGTEQVKVIFINNKIAGFSLPNHLQSVQYLSVPDRFYVKHNNNGNLIVYGDLLKRKYDKIREENRQFAQIGLESYDLFAFVNDQDKTTIRDIPDVVKYIRSLDIYKYALYLKHNNLLPEQKPIEQFINIGLALRGRIELTPLKIRKLLKFNIVPLARIKHKKSQTGMDLLVDEFGFSIQPLRFSVYQINFEAEQQKLTILNQTQDILNTVFGIKKTNSEITWEMISTNPNFNKLIFDPENGSFFVHQMFNFDKNKLTAQLYQIKNDYIIIVFDRYSKRYNYFLYVNPYIKDFYNKK